MTAGIVSPAIGCAVKEVFRGSGVIDKKVQWKLDPGFQFVSHIVREDPPQMYNVCYQRFAKESAMRQERCSANANFSADAALEVGGGSMKVEPVPKKEDQNKKDSLDVETNGDLLIFDISGGKRTLCCGGEASTIVVYIHLRRSDIEGRETLEVPVYLRPSDIEARKTLEVPAIAFGARDWKTFYGDVGVEPPLPSDINEILESPCPIWPGKL